MSPSENREDWKRPQLHTDAVNRLVNASPDTAPKVSEDELKKYRSGKLRLPDLLKTLLIKLWFGGAVCYFILWGLGGYVSDMLLMIIVLGLVMGMVTDLLTNNVLRFTGKSKEYSRVMLVTKTGVAGFLLNLLYGMVCIACVVMLYALMNSILPALGMARVGVGPILFGLFYALSDTAFILLKGMCGRMLRDALRQSR